MPRQFKFFSKIHDLKYAYFACKNINYFLLILVVAWISVTSLN